MTSSQTPQQTTRIVATELKSCCSARSSLRQLSATNAESRNINNIDSAAPTSSLGSTTQDPSPPPKAKRKNHRGGKSKKKGKGKKAATGDVEKPDVTRSEKDLGNLEKQGIVLELESEATPMAKAEVVPSKGNCNKTSTTATSRTDDRLVDREEGANSDDRDGASVTGDLDAAIDQRKDESTTFQNITVTLSKFDDNVVAHVSRGDAIGTNEALTLATGEDAATTVEKARITKKIAEDETTMTGHQEVVVIGPSVEEAKAAVVVGVDVDGEAAALEAIAAVVEEDAVAEGREANLAVEQQSLIEAERAAPVVEIGGQNRTAEQDLTIAQDSECQPSRHDGGETFPTKETVAAKYKDESQQRASPTVQEDSRKSCSSSMGRTGVRAVIDCMYEIKLAPGKGLGMFAKGVIPRGARIIEEEALLVVPEMSYSAVLPAFASLEPGKKAIFMELAGADDEEEAENLAWYLAEAEKDVDLSEHIAMNYEDQAAVQLKFGSNSFNMTAHTSGIFPIASRMNHSCIPNVYHTWNQHINRLTVHALQNIAQGEELLTTYIPAILTWDQRNDDEHLGHYGFTCDCPACDPKSEFFKQSDFRRTSAVAIEEHLASYFASGSPKDAFVPDTGLLSGVEALQYAQLRVNLLIEEGIVNMDLVKWYVDWYRLLLGAWSYTDRRYSIHEAGELALLCGDYEEARTCAKTAVWLTETCAGKDSPHMAVLRIRLIEAEQKLGLCRVDDGQQGRRVCL